MRSPLLLRRSQSLLRASAISSYSTHAGASRLRQQIALGYGGWLSKRLVSTIFSSSNDPDAPSPNTESPQTSADPPEKPKQSRRPASKESDTPLLPSGLDILWTPDPSPLDPTPSRSHALPPEEIFEEALNNLHITLHPHTQHRATYTSPDGPPVEPTFALYCPIEGGDYVIDETIRDLARRTNAEVIVLDSVQLAAGEWGHFGKAANALKLPRNPLHFPSSAPHISRIPSRPTWDDDDEQESPAQMSTSSQMTLTVMAPGGATRGSPFFTPSSRGGQVAPNKIKTLFDEIINIPSRPSECSNSPRRTRIIYVRDFSTLAPTSSTWYPPLLSAVRQRRQGAMSRPASPISNPTTIVFGITPSITPSAPYPSLSGPSGHGLTHFLVNRNQSYYAHTPKPGKSDWSECESADKARERRLKDRLRKWEKGDAVIQEELPSLSSEEELDESSNGPERPASGIVVIGGPGPGGMSGLPPILGHALSARAVASRGSAEPEGNARFFRTTVLVPSVRSLVQERACRVSRRREINELTIRMGVGAVGGSLSIREEPTELCTSEENRIEEEVQASEKPSISDEEKMWDDWGQRIEVWPTVRQIADRAVGSVVAAPPTATPSGKPEKLTLDATIVPWSAVHKAWVAQRSSRVLRRTWMKESSTKLARDLQDEEDGEGKDDEDANNTDEVVERVKQDQDLDQHEQRLLSCIVDSASMPTSFSQVHLPSHTIDSVRTIVSLPLLHPAAFQQGILKDHGMTGCLLFGPPGTGKTLVIRALAKEAGCRMMAVSPSDVMDMYVGEGEKLVKAVFSLARKISPCVVFLDEIDALFGARISARESGGAFAHRGVITEFMQEMDGLKSSRDDSVIVIGATNRPFDLDDAVLRRLPRRLLVDLPGEKEREEILKILLRDETLSSDVNLKALAKETETFSGSDLKHLCVSAALDAVKERMEVPWSHTSESINTPSDALDAASPAVVLNESTSYPESTSLVESSESLLASPSQDTSLDPSYYIRTLHPHNFIKALKEITPSSSESLGSLADLRRWNEEFGEGRKNRKKQVWGKDIFGFTNKENKTGEEGRVALVGTPLV